VIQPQQPRQNIIVRERRIPAVCGEGCFIKFAVREVEPGRPFVVEVCERALRELFSRFVIAWNKARVTDSANAALIRIADIARPWSIN
jgi:hypothetical protein